MAFIKLNRYPKIDLLNIDFNYIAIEEEDFEKGDIDLKILDKYNVKDYDENSVYIEFTRKVFFEPEMFYNILVKLGVTYELNEKTDKELNKKNLEKEIEENKRMFIPVLEKTSLLIGNITNIDDDLTVITPPFFHEEE